MPKRKAKKKGSLLLGFLVLGSLFAITQPQLLESLIPFIFNPFFIFLLVAFLLIRGLSRNEKPSSSSITSPRFEMAGSSLVPQIIEKPEKWTMDLISKLEWKCFEELCTGCFDAKGYRAQLSRQGADGGIDIFLYKADSSQMQPYGIVQCKAWNTYKVGVKAIRELYGVMAAENASIGVFITSGNFTQEALKFSDGKPLKLLTGESLLELIESLPGEVQQRLLKQVTSGDYTTPSCPSCGIKMIERISSKGNNAGNTFWGCPNYPRCRNTLKSRQGQH